jgi:hypothetical protein
MNSDFLLFWATDAKYWISFGLSIHCVSRDNRPAKVWCIKWGRSHYLWFFCVWRELTINMSSTKSLAGTKGLLQRDCCECFVYENLETKTAFRALLLSCATHINRHVHVYNLFVFSGSTPNTTVLQVFTVKHKECGRFLQIVFMWEGDDFKMTPKCGRLGRSGRQFISNLCD